jgi:hypothetical protein
LAQKLRTSPGRPPAVTAADHALGLVQSGGADLVEGGAQVVAHGVEHEGS